MFNKLDLCRRYRVTRKTIDAWVREGYLPRPLRIGPRCVRWSEESIKAAEQRLATASQEGN